MNHTILAATLALGAVFASSNADAHPVVVSAAVPGISIVVGAPPPVVVQPAPVYVEPAPVYVEPVPAYYAPEPVYYAPPPPPVVYHRPYARPVRTIVYERPRSEPCHPGHAYGHDRRDHGRRHRR